MRSVIAAVTAALGILALACASERPAPAFAPEGAPRYLLRTAAQTVEVDELLPAVERVSAIAAELGGRVESAVQSERRASLEVRVPAGSLDVALARIAELGRERERRVDSRDVTDEVADLEAWLANRRALRDRLRQLLERAGTVEEVLKVESELTRLQTEIDQQAGRLERLRSQVELSQLRVELERSRILGPLGWTLDRAVWALGKLFVIRD